MTLDSRIPEVRAGVSAAITEAMQAGADLLLEKSNALAPVKDGDLRASGQSVAHGARAEVGYSAPYAIRQHEGLNFNHPRGGEAKFLETAFHAYSSQILDEVAQTLREVLE